MTTETPDRKRRRKETPVEKQKQEHEERQRQDERPLHLAPIVLADYFSQRGIVLGEVWGGGVINSGTAVCIGLGHEKSRWRVQCNTVFDGEHGPTNCPIPTACLWVNTDGKITEVISDKEIRLSL